MKKSKIKNGQKDNVKDQLQYELTKVFVRVLEDAGVFKLDEKGKKYFIEFIEEAIGRKRRIMKRASQIINDIQNNKADSLFLDIYQDESMIEFQKKKICRCN